jgi:membrane fusion protein, heavy metal efflux system
MKVFSIIFLCIFFISCAQKQNQPGLQVNDTLQTTDTIKNNPDSNSIECEGVIEFMPGTTSTVYTPVNGIIKKVYVNKGITINKGAALVTLWHTDVIKLEQEYLEAKSKLDYYKEDFKRQGELTIEDAAPIKRMQQAQSDYKMLDARAAAIKAQLKLLFIQADSLSAENISPYFTLYAESGGTIINTKAEVGKFMNSNDLIYEIANLNRLQLVLLVNEKYWGVIHKGQTITFVTASNNTKYELKVNNIDQTINSDMHTFKAYSTPVNNKELPSGLSVKARIQVNE